MKCFSCETVAAVEIIDGENGLCEVCIRDYAHSGLIGGTRGRPSIPSAIASCSQCGEPVDYLRSGKLMKKNILRHCAPCNKHVEVVWSRKNFVPVEKP